MTFVLGTIHAFSVFIPQWELTLNASRASVSLIYSLALASLTVAVLFGHLLFSQFKPATLFIVSGTFAAAGLALSANSDSLISLYTFYGIVFGGANGIGYGYALQLAGQATPLKKGFSMGLVTAFYAVGATMAPVLLLALIEHSGNSLALTTLAVILLLVSLFSAALLVYSKASYHGESANSKTQPLAPQLKLTRAFLWISYGGAVAAGLMVIGHAYGIAVWLSPNNSAISLAPVLVAFGNMLGGFSAGYFADRLSSRLLLRWLPLLTCAGLLFLISPVNTWTLALLGSLVIVGYSYGAIIAVYPVAISDIFTAEASPRIYGQIFTAWGVAGLVGPWLSGWLFDQTGTYTYAILIAIVLSALSIFSILFCIPSTLNWQNTQNN